MKCACLSLLLLPLFLSAAPRQARADQLIPAGSVITCTVSEGNISSKTEKIGDAVLCELNHTELYGRTTFPFGSYLEGHFAEYKDPGHFAGKGYMTLDFDKLVVQPDTVVPINARVVAAPKNKVDAEGRILGNGHATRDTILWLIPVLWPIDLINLPRRGPRPVLKAETRLTLKVQDDFGIPTPQEDAIRKPALISRQTPDEPTYEQYRPQRAPLQQNYPAQQNYQQPAPQYPPQYAPQQPYAQPGYAPSGYAQSGYAQSGYASQIVVVQSPPQTVVVQQQPQAPVYIQPRPRFYGYPPPPYGFYPPAPYSYGYNPY